MGKAHQLNFTIALNQDMYDRLSELAKRSGVSRGKIMRQAAILLMDGVVPDERIGECAAILRREQSEKLVLVDNPAPETAEPTRWGAFRNVLDRV